MTPAEQLEALEAVKIDLGFIGLRESLSEPNLAGECVARYETLVAVSDKSPLSKKRRIDLKDIERVFLVGMSESAYPGWQDAVNSSLSVVGLAAPRSLQEADGVQAMLSIVASGMGVALLPEHIKFQRYSGVRFRPLSQPLKVKSWIAWRPDNRSKPLDQYIRIVKEALG
jgi:DNA-binding transcriptional LysR family regulator